MYKTNDFISLRTGILKNHILNKLLIANLKNRATLHVGNSLIRLAGKSRTELSKRSEKLPSFICASVIVKMNDPYFKIGHSYPNITDVWGNVITAKGGSVVADLKYMATVIYTTYQPVAYKIDNIFSEAPRSLSILLEREKISRYYWKRGLSHSIKIPDGDIDETELKEYFDRLTVKLLDLRIWNSILIELTKSKQFEKEIPEFGKLTAYTLSPSEVHLVFVDYTNNNFTSMILEYADFTPLAWEKSDFMPGLRKLFNAQLR